MGNRIGCIVFGLLALSFLSTGNSWAVGLGDTFSEFDRAWGKGYRQEFPIGSGVIDVRVGRDRKRSISYSKGWNDFAGRVGKIQGETWGLFGAADNSLPSTKQFLTGIKSMMPADARLVAKYTSSKLGWLRELYIFHSPMLAKKPEIGKSLAYYYETKAIGKFFLAVNHNIDDSRYVVNFMLSLGNGESDAFGMKKVKTAM